MKYIRKYNESVSINLPSLQEIKDYVQVIEDDIDIHTIDISNIKKSFDYNVNKQVGYKISYLFDDTGDTHDVPKRFLALIDSICLNITNDYSNIVIYLKFAQRYKDGYKITIEIINRKVDIIDMDSETYMYNNKEGYFRNYYSSKKLHKGNIRSIITFGS